MTDKTPELPTVEYKIVHQVSDDIIKDLLKKVDTINSTLHQVMAENDELKKAVKRIESFLTDEQIEVAAICNISPVEYATQLMKFQQLKSDGHYRDYH